MNKKPNAYVTDDVDRELELGPADTRDSFERRMLKYYGLQPRDEAACPRIVAGLRCRLQLGPALSAHCICEFGAHHLRDHGNLWRDVHGRPVLTWEPYGIDGEEFANVVRELIALKLRIEVEAYSPWYPGHTVLVLIRRA